MQKNRKEDFSSFRPAENEGLDSFQYEQIGERREYAELWQNAKEILTLSHGQS